MRGSLVELRPMESLDSELLYKWHNEKDIIDLTGISLPVYMNTILEMTSTDSSYRNAIRFMIIPKGENTAIGTVSLDSIDWINKSAEYALIFGEKDLWSKGYGVDTTKAIIDYAFMSLGLNRLYLKTFQINSMAIRCYQNSGFIEEGRLREGKYWKGKRQDVILMSILRSDYQGMTQGDPND